MSRVASCRIVSLRRVLPCIVSLFGAFVSCRVLVLVSPRVASSRRIFLAEVGATCLHPGSWILSGLCFGAVGHFVLQGRHAVRTLLHGSSVTIIRNMGLFSSFSIYRDILSSLNPSGISPFWMGAICSNLAWLTIWPLAA